MKNILAALLALACMYPCIVHADDTKPAATDAKPEGAKDDAKKDDAKKDDTKKDDAKKEIKPVEVEGSVTIDGKVINYIAKAGMLPGCLARQRVSGAMRTRLGSVRGPS